MGDDGTGIGEVEDGHKRKAIQDAGALEGKRTRDHRWTQMRGE